MMVGHTGTLRATPGFFVAELAELAHVKIRPPSVVRISTKLSSMPPAGLISSGLYLRVEKWRCQWEYRLTVGIGQHDRDAASGRHWQWALARNWAGSSSGTRSVEAIFAPELPKWHATFLFGQVQGAGQEPMD